MTDPAAVSSVAMSAGEALAWLAITAAGALGAGIAGYRQFLKRCLPAEPAAVHEQRADALLALTQSFDAFAKIVGAFIVHVQEQHEAHRRELARQTDILGRLTDTVTEIRVRQEVAPR